MNQFKHPLQKYGKPTGSLRDARWAAMRNGWVECEHFCLTQEEKIEKLSGKGENYRVTIIHGKWMHWIHPSFTCHFPLINQCPQCYEYPTESNLLRNKRK